MWPQLAEAAAERVVGVRSVPVWEAGMDAGIDLALAVLAGALGRAPALPAGESVCGADRPASPLCRAARRAVDILGGGLISNAAGPQFQAAETNQIVSIACCVDGCEKPDAVAGNGTISFDRCYAASGSLARWERGARFVVPRAYHPDLAPRRAFRGSFAVAAAAARAAAVAALGEPGGAGADAAGLGDDCAEGHAGPQGILLRWHQLLGIYQTRAERTHDPVKALPFFRPHNVIFDIR